jgi:hypothetical protein
VRVRALQLFYAGIATCYNLNDSFNVANPLRCTYSKNTVANLDTLLLKRVDGKNLRVSVWSPLHHDSIFPRDKAQKHLNLIKPNRKLHSPSIQLIFIHESSNLVAVHINELRQVQFPCVKGYLTELPELKLAPAKIKL